MSGEPSAPLPETSAAWPTLSLHERRVLGVLVEKAKTTPEAYPLSLNALVTGSNQKSNRDPLLDLSNSDVEAGLLELQKKGLVFRVTGSRVDRWRHALYEAWHVEKVELAVLGELLLRGAQTEGELRARASRMEPIPDLDALRPVLRKLAERRLAVFLGEEGRRGTTITHGFHEPTDLERQRAAPAPSREPAAGGESRDGRLADAFTQIAALQAAVAELQSTVAELKSQLQKPGTTPQ